MAQPAFDKKAQLRGKDHGSVDGQCRPSVRVLVVAVCAGAFGWMLRRHAVGYQSFLERTVGRGVVASPELLADEEAVGFGIAAVGPEPVQVGRRLEACEEAVEASRQFLAAGRVVPSQQHLGPVNLIGQVGYGLRSSCPADRRQLGVLAVASYHEPGPGQV